MLPAGHLPLLGGEWVCNRSVVGGSAEDLHAIDARYVRQRPGQRDFVETARCAQAGEWLWVIAGEGVLVRCDGIQGLGAASILVDGLQLYPHNGADTFRRHPIPEHCAIQAQELSAVAVTGRDCARLAAAQVGERVTVGAGQGGGGIADDLAIQPAEGITVVRISLGAGEELSTTGGHIYIGGVGRVRIAAGSEGGVEGAVAGRVGDATDHLVAVTIVADPDVAAAPV